MIKSGKVPEVNGFIVHASNKSGFFRYHGYMQTSIPPRTYTFKGGQGHILEVYGTAQEGGYSVSFCENGGRSDMAAIHVRQGEFGILYELKNQAFLWPTVINKVDEHKSLMIFFMKSITFSHPQYSPHCNQVCFAAAINLRIKRNS